MFNTEELRILHMLVEDQLEEVKKNIKKTEKDMKKFEQQLKYDSHARSVWEEMYKDLIDFRNILLGIKQKISDVLYIEQKQLVDKVLAELKQETGIDYVKLLSGDEREKRKARLQDLQDKFLDEVTEENRHEEYDFGTKDNELL